MKITKLSQTRIGDKFTDRDGHKWECTMLWKRVVKSVFKYNGFNHVDNENYDIIRIERDNTLIFER